MRAVVVHAPMDYAVENVPVPDCPAGGMLLEVDACGLCGSDLRTLRQGHRRVVFPWVLGHEICGTVHKLGPDYTGPWRTGDRLSIGPLVFCGKCDFCRDGRYELCEQYRRIAQAWPGGFAEYLAIPEAAVRHGTICKVPQGLDPAPAAIAEPVSSCVHAQERARVGLGDTVVVLGVGPIGCTHVSLARARGADRVIVADVNETRLAMSVDFGPDHAIDAADTDVVSAVRELTDGKGAEVVITANSTPESQVQAVQMARRGGRILFFGGLPKNQDPPGIDTKTIHDNALHVIGSTIFAPRHQRTALQLLADSRIPGNKLVTHRFGLERFAEGVQMALEGRVRKAVFLP